jgi:hypothetical protein
MRLPRLRQFTPGKCAGARSPARPRHPHGLRADSAVQQRHYAIAGSQLPSRSARRSIRPTPLGRLFCCWWERPVDWRWPFWPAADGAAGARSVGTLADACARRRESRPAASARGAADEPTSGGGVQRNAGAARERGGGCVSSARPSRTSCTPSQLRGEIDVASGSAQTSTSTGSRVSCRTDKLKRLIDQLLTLARAEVGEIPLAREPVDPGRCATPSNSSRWPRRGVAPPRAVAGDCDRRR